MAESTLRVIQDQIREALRAPKCHRCGCLHKTVEAFAGTEAGQHELAPVLREAKSVFTPLEYDCLACAVCYPAIAANAFAETYPETAARLDLCPTEPADERVGWPPLPGDYVVLRYGAPVAVCTLNSSQLTPQMCDLSPSGLSIVGTLHTENLGIERLIRNVNSNPNLRFLIVCGEDTQQRIGHLPGQSLTSLFANGVDERLRIIGAHGKRPVLKNVTGDAIATFRRNVEVVDLVGEERPSLIADQIVQYSSRNPSAVVRSSFYNAIEAVVVEEVNPLVLDPAGYFVVYPESRRRALVLEHYTNNGLLDAALEGHTAGALYQAAISRGLVSRLDHAAYLGRELGRAEQRLNDGKPYIQDRAPEPQPVPKPPVSKCDCSEGSCS